MRKKDAYLQGSLAFAFLPFKYMANVLATILIGRKSRDVLPVLAKREYLARILTELESSSFTNIVGYWVRYQ